MPTVKNQRKYPLDLDDGTILQAGASATVDVTWPIVARMITNNDLQITDAVNPPAPVLNTSGRAIARVKAGTPADSDYATSPPVGTIVVDSTGSKIWVKTATSGGWKSVLVA